MMTLADLLLGNVPLAPELPRRPSEASNHPKLPRARALLEKDPDLSRRDVYREVGVGPITLKYWEEHGWLTFKKQAGGLGRPELGENHPALPRVRAELLKDPERTAKSLSLQFSIGEATLRMWRRLGWITLVRPPKPNNAYLGMSSGGPCRMSIEMRSGADD